MEKPVLRKIPTRGMLFSGKVVSAKAKNTAVVEIGYSRRVQKYDRFQKRRSKIHVHIPEGSEVAVGDVIRFAECRKVSKTKSHVLVGKIAGQKK